MIPLEFVITNRGHIREAKSSLIVWPKTIIGVNRQWAKAIEWLPCIECENRYPSQYPLPRMKDFAQMLFQDWPSASTSQIHFQRFIEQILRDCPLQRVSGWDLSSLRRRWRILDWRWRNLKKYRDIINPVERIAIEIYGLSRSDHLW